MANENNTKDPIEFRVESVIRDEESGNIGCCKTKSKVYARIKDTYFYLFFILSTFGLYVLSSKNGNYVTSKVKIIVATTCIMDFLVGISMYTYVLLQPLPYWYVVMVLPTALCFVYVLFLYCLIIKNRHRQKEYMAALNVLVVNRKWHFYPRMMFLYAFSFVIAVPNCLLLPTEIRLYGIQPLTIVSSVPVFQDVYVTTLLWCLTAGYQAVEEKVRSVDVWDNETVAHVSYQWLQMKKLLELHNDVSFDMSYITCTGLHKNFILIKLHHFQIFKVISFHRMILFTAQAMSYLYIMTTFNNQDSTCLPLLGFAILFLMEMVIRLSQFCEAGEGLYIAVRICFDRMMILQIH